jgi:hypothetical protein
VRCTFLERQNFSYAGQFFKSTYTNNNPNCLLVTSNVNWINTAEFFSSATRLYALDVDGTCEGEAVWTKGATTIQSGSVVGLGAITRTNTSVVIATTQSWRQKRTTYNLSSRSRVHNQGLEFVDPVTKNETGANGTCCGEDQVAVFDKMVSGDPVTNSAPPVVSSSFAIEWVAVVTASVFGLQIVRTSASPSSDPWILEVAGGEIRLTNAQGNTTVYSGTVASAVSSINASGLFSASVMSSTSAALVFDLRPVRTDPFGQGCIKRVLIADVGDRIAMGIPGYQARGSFWNVQFNASSFGYGPNVNGFTAWLLQGWYPKLTSSSLAFGAFQSLSSTYLGLNTSLWQQNERPSVVTQQYVIPGESEGCINAFGAVTNRTDTWGCIGCIPFNGPEDPCFPPPPNVDWSGASGVCNFSPFTCQFEGNDWVCRWSDCNCDPTNIVVCVNGTVSYLISTEETLICVPQADIVLEMTQSINGRLRAEL